MTSKDHIGMCALCKQRKQLRNSHIIPEWAYRAMYDTQHNFFVISDSSYTKRRQKGEYERLLCKSCEQETALLDEYGHEVVFAKPSRSKFKLSTSQDNEGHLCLHNVDYRRMKLFQLSVLWRAGVSKRAFFKQVQLGPHEPKIRDMLIAQNPGDPDDYGCLMVAHTDGNSLFLDALPEPVYCRFHGHKGYAFMFAGCSYLYVVSSHGKQYRYRDYFLQPNTPLRMMVAHPKDVPWLNKHFPNVLRTLPKR